MSNLYIVELPGLGQSNSDGAVLACAPTDALANQAIAVSSNAQNSAPFNAKTRVLRLTAGVPVSVVVSPNATIVSATANRYVLTSGQTDYVMVPPGDAYALSVIQQTP